MKYIIEISERVVSHVKIDYMDISDNDRAMMCDAIRTAIPYEERPHGEWIPCSERLPKDPDTKRIYASKTYQVTTVDGRTIVLLWRKTESRGKMVMRWEWHDGRIYHGDVLAWKPLSEPYREEGDDK